MNADYTLRNRFLLGVALLLVAAPTQVAAGTITFRAFQFKGHIVETEPSFRLFDTELVIDDSVIPPITEVIPNDEEIELVVGEYDLWNFYMLRIEIPQDPFDPSLDIDLFWFVAADTGSGIGPLPAGAGLVSAGMFGNRTGTRYPATITPLNDLANLPTSSANDLMILWDLSSLSQTTGNFQLARVSMPGNEILAPIPEPSTLILMCTGIGILCRRRRVDS